VPFFFFTNLYGLVPFKDFKVVTLGVESCTFRTHILSNMYK